MRMLFSVLITVWLMAPHLNAATAAVFVTSPEGKARAVIRADRSNQLVYSIQFDGKPVLAESRIGVIIDGVDHGAGIRRLRTVRGPEHVTFRFPWLGIKSEVAGQMTTTRILVSRHDGGEWILEVACMADAVAWRGLFPGTGTRTVGGESSTWVFPAGSRAWCNPNTVQYEGIHEVWSMEAPATNRFIQGVGMPVTVELPWGGFAAIAEADVMHYSGMTLEPIAPHTFAASFRDERRGWQMTGEIKTPWRVVMFARDLNGLVNCDAIPALCPPPDPALFPAGPLTDFIKPGRCLWQWWAYNDPGTEWSRQKTFVDQAAALNCQYYLVDEGWENPAFGWITTNSTQWDALKELCEYAAARGVGIWVWRGWRQDIRKHWPGLETPEKREEFFRRCAELGVKGLKIDFMDSESHERLAFYQDCLRLGAKYRLMINFHGANKPAGEARTWPNELTREAVRGLEYNKWSTLPPHHYATLPFTRYLAGHGDFTPTTLQPQFLKGTTVALQLACAVVYTSPFLCWADKPEVYLDSPVVDVIRNMPTVWDETRVLPQSKIGELAAFARRHRTTWWIGVINGGTARDFQLDFSFLPPGQYSGDFYADVPNAPARFRIETGQHIMPGSRYSVWLEAGGGFVGIVKPLAK